MAASLEPTHRPFPLLLRLVFTLCLLATILFIFSNSAQSGQLSGLRSIQVTNVINGLLQRLNIPFAFTEHLLRKLAHFLEYIMLGFWLLLTFGVHTRRLLPLLAWPLFLGLLVPVADETLQLFVPERGGQLSDVLIDFSGVLTGLFVGYVALLLVRAIFRQRKGFYD